MRCTCGALKGDHRNAAVGLLCPDESGTFVKNDVPGRLECKNTKWRTPEYIVNAIHGLLGGIRLDPSANESNNCRAAKFYVEGGLSLPWEDGTYCNPPYGDELPDWMRCGHRWAKERLRIAMMLPCGARFSTRYYQENVLTETLSGMLVFNHRIKFDGEEPGSNNMWDSILYMHNIPVQQAVKHLKGLGKVVSTEVWS